MSNKSIFILIAIIILVGVGGYVWSSAAPVETNNMQEETDAMMEEDSDVMVEDNSDAMMEKGGTYIPYSSEMLALAETGKVVLFFRASWCPTCRALDADIKSDLSKIPENVTILDVDYDNSTALKQKYGVTMQHTLVQVDASGNQIAKWTNSPTLTSLVGNIK